MTNDCSDGSFLGHPLSRSPGDVPVQQAPADELVRLGCLDYCNRWQDRVPEGDRLLRERPELAAATLWTVVAVGDAERATALLDADPEAINRDGGPYGWPPLLYLAYSRLSSGDPRHDALSTLRVLLARGADPDAGFLWAGNVPPFTALTGVLGGGERQEPPHPRWPELAAELLAAGAEANDHQAIYNRGAGDLAVDDTDFLELLRGHGLGTGDGGPWVARLDGALPTPADLLAEILQHAAEHGLERRVALVLEWGADPDHRSEHPVYGGRSPFAGAIRNGNLVVAELLAAAGADTSGVDDVDRVIAGALAGDDRAGAAPELVAAAIQRDPLAIVRVGELGRPSAVTLMARLGWNVDALGRATALHEAAFRGDGATVDALLAAGADTTIRDRSFDGLPSDWARHGGHPELADRLAPKP